jgi:hypothetical protein
MAVRRVDLCAPVAAESVSAPLLAVVPVYGGRVPEVALERLRALKGNGGPAIAVVVYGNRAYEDALLELHTELTANGYKVIAAAAFIAEHSIVRSISGKNDSKATKLRKAFNWVIGKSYSIHRNFSPSMTNWPAIYANDHFDSIGGDCHADGAAFAYLAAAIGYDADQDAFVSTFTAMSRDGQTLWGVRATGQA